MADGVEEAFTVQLRDEATSARPILKRMLVLTAACSPPDTRVENAPGSSVQLDPKSWMARTLQTFEVVVCSLMQFPRFRSHSACLQ